MEVGMVELERSQTSAAAPESRGPSGPPLQVALLDLAEAAADLERTVAQVKAMEELARFMAEVVEEVGRRAELGPKASS
jgi:hypothetical protein